MVRAEACWVLNAMMCASALPLGGKLAGLPAPHRGALGAGAALGGATGLMGAMLPGLWPLWMLGLPASVGLCFGAHGARACLRCTLTTLGATLLLGGAATALEGAGVAALGMTLALGWLIYFLVTLQPQAACDVRQVELRVGDRAVVLPAMLDSGNRLRDPVTGLPVVVAPRRALRRLYPSVGDGGLADLPLGFRLLSVRTAAGSALLPLFKPDLCRLYVNGQAREAALLVAVAGREYAGAQALVPTSALADAPFGAY